MRRRAWLLVPFAALALSACSGEEDPASPVIERFEAQPMIVEPGADVRLVWTVVNAERIFVRTSTRTVIETVELEGVTMARNIREDTLFTLEATNPAGSSFATVRVAILRGPPPVIDRFTVSPSMILLGQGAMLEWETTNAIDVALSTSDGEPVLARATPSGSLAVTPDETTTYVLTATNRGGVSTREVTLEVDDPRPEIRSFTASPASIPLGAVSTLAWDVSEADEIVISALGSLVLRTHAGTGTATVAPEMTAEFELSATNAFGTRIARVTVEVLVPQTPAITRFRAVPNPIPLGASTRLEYAVGDADRIRIFLGGDELTSGTAPTGALMVSPPAQSETAYRLEAENDVGVSTATVVVFQHGQPVLESFSLAPNELSASATVAITYSVRETHELRLSANGAPLSGFPRTLSGGAAVAETAELPLFVEGTTFFEIEAVSAAGTAQGSAVAVLGFFESEPNDGPAPADPHPGTGVDAAGRIEHGADQDWYRLTVPSSGNIRAETTDATGTCARVDTVLTVFAPNGVTEIATDDDGGNGACSRIDPSQAAGLAAGTYYVVVSSKGGSTGDYAVSIRAVGPGCGNGLVEGAEECDDGNNTSSDGCDASCRAEGIREDEAGGNDTAGGAGVLLTGGDGTFFGSISPVGDVDFFAVTMPDGFNLEAYLTVNSLDDCPPNPRGALALIAPNGSTLLAADDSGGPRNNCGRIAVDTTAAALQMAGGTYFLRVTELGNDAEIPVYFLHVRIHPAGCGNGVTEPGESCDDGNQSSGDGCNSSCQWEIGPTITPPGGMAMVSLSGPGAAAIVRVNILSGGQSISAVAADPGLSSCDGVDTLLELRDSAFRVLGSKAGGGPSGAAGECARLVAGVDFFSTDLAAGAHYLFVRSQGGSGNASLSVQIVNPACGNDIRETRAGEHCDDGNLMNGDGCSSACLLEQSSGAEMEPNGTQATANPTSLVGLGMYTVVGANNPAGDDDVYSFIVPAGPTLRFSARTYSMVGAPNSCDSNRTDTRLLLERAGTESTGPATGELAYNDDRSPATNVWCSELSNIRLGAGTYYVRVQGWNDTQVTSYLLDLTLAP